MPANNGCEKCPYRNQNVFEEYKADCEGLRIRLDTHDHLVGRNLTRMCVVGEVALHACGSDQSPDSHLPTMPDQDYADTRLRVFQLKKLYDQNLLPSQVAEGKAVSPTVNQPKILYLGDIL